MTLRLVFGARLRHSPAAVILAQLRFADAVALWLNGKDSVSLENACGVAGNWRSTLRRRRRDDLYAEIARTLFPDLKGTPCARAIIAAIDRYQTSSWRYDRDNGRRPAGPNALLYDLLSLGERLLDIEALRKLPGIFRAGEYQDQDLRSEREENHFEYDDEDESVFEGSESR